MSISVCVVVVVYVVVVRTQGLRKIYWSNFIQFFFLQILNLRIDSTTFFIFYLTLFWPKMSTSYKSGTVYFLKPRRGPSKGIISKSGIQVQITMLERIFGHENEGNRFRGWAALERKGMFLTLIVFNSAQPSLNHLTDIKKYCT